MFDDDYRWAPEPGRLFGSSQDFLMRSYMRFSRRPITPITIVTPLETSTPAEILAELREEDPRSAMMLGEFLTLDRDGRLPEGQAADLAKWLGLS